MKYDNTGYDQFHFLINTLEKESVRLLISHTPTQQEEAAKGKLWIACIYANSADDITVKTYRGFGDDPIEALGEAFSTYRQQHKVAA